MQSSIFRKYISKNVHDYFHKESMCVCMQVIDTCVPYPSLYCMNSLCTVTSTVAVAGMIPSALDIAWQVYCPPWDVCSGLNSRVWVNMGEDPIRSPRVTFFSLPSGVPSESIHSKVRVSINDTAQSATVTVQVRVSVSPALVVPGWSIEAERAGTVERRVGGRGELCSYKLIQIQ